MTNEVRECLAEMGVTEAVFVRIRTASNHTDGERLLDEAKEICRKGFRSVASKYHPDQNQHLQPDEIKAKEERFKRLRSVHDSFLESRYRGPRRSKTQMGAANFDPFGFHPDAEEILRYWSDPDLVQRVREARRRERIRWAQEILNRNTKPAAKPRITPMQIPGGGVWMRDEASCQPQPRKPRRRK